MRCWISGTWDLYSSSESLLMTATSMPLRYNRSFTFSVGPRVTTGRTCVTPPSFSIREISVAKRMGAPSSRPPARPMVEALTRSLISASLDEERLETLCVWAKLELHDSKVPSRTTRILAIKYIATPTQEKRIPPVHDLLSARRSAIQCEPNCMSWPRYLFAVTSSILQRAAKRGQRNPNCL